jgi:replication factor A1
MKIGEIEKGMENINTNGQITKIFPPREIRTKFGKSFVATAILKDDTGEIELTLWGKQITQVHVGDNIEIIGGYAKEFKGKVQLNVGKQGKISVKNNQIEDI